MRFHLGGKNGAGVWQRIINELPPHEIYIEPFLGSGAVLRHKLPARRSIGLDLDPGALAAIADAVPPRTELMRRDAIEFLAAQSGWYGRETVIYCDPPYPHGTRTSDKRYRHELMDDQHRRLLRVLCAMQCRIAISTYQNPIYGEILGAHRWRLVSFTAGTRGGPRMECLWLNYPPPERLHDYRFLGRTFRDRERIRRKQRRWVARLQRMDAQERSALLAAIAETGRLEPSPHSTGTAAN